jgi:hypothetical protein
MRLMELTSIALLILAPASPEMIHSVARPDTNSVAVLVDNFEAYQVGGLPLRWQFLKGHEVVPVSPEVMTEQEQFFIVQEQGNKFLRARVTDQAHRLMLVNGERIDWDLHDLPILQWDWRAIQLPVGAREDRSNLNDTGAAVYVFFERDWLGRPRVIKYTYSSSLPVGTEVSYGRLKVIVVSSAREGVGRWQTITRNVAEDYRYLFGKEPPARPEALAVWSDSDNLDQTAIADFDNVALLPMR